MCCAVRLYAAKVSAVQLDLLQLNYLHSAVHAVILSAAKVSAVQLEANMIGL